ncbi:MAG: M48 family metalloprotease [Gammaproteobacteria bacterium]|nr:M48 family metalloprotease [Gammaproteobacteria bacterium]
MSINLILRHSIVFLIIALSGCAVNPVTGEADFVLMSEDEEIAIGRQNHAKIIQRYGLYDAPALQDYVQKIGDKLAIKSHRRNLIFRFTVLDSSDINAFALPGGYIYITRGLMAYLSNEAELAAVLGHEIGHVTARHGVRQQSAAAATGLFTAVLASQAGFIGAGNLLNTIGFALIRGYGRDNELESDRLGAEYLALSGYDPMAMLEVLRVLKNQEIYDKQLAKDEDREPKAYHGVFATHPDNDTRLQQVIKRATQLQKANLNNNNQVAFLRNIEGMVFGDSEKHGILRGNKFYHRELNIYLKLPKGWRIENQANRIIAVAPKNKGLLQITAVDINKRITPKQFLKQRLKLDKLQNGERIQNRDLEGYTAISSVSRTVYGTRPVRFVVIYKQNTAWVFQGLAKDEKKPYQFDDEIINTAKSFRTLTTAERKQAKPRRIHIISAKQNTRFADLAKQSQLGTNAEAQLRLLNKHYPDGEPKPGTALKIIQ